MYTDPLLKQHVCFQKELIKTSSREEAAVKLKPTVPSSALLWSEHHTESHHSLFHYFPMLTEKDW